MINALEIRKIIGTIVLSVIWVCCFIFIKSSLIVDWFDNGSFTTNLQLLVVTIVLLIIFFYNLLYQSSTETTKLSWTVVLTVAWLALILFYPFKDPTNYAGGAVGFFALIGGLAVVVLWVRFFSDEMVA